MTTTTFTLEAIMRSSITAVYGFDSYYVYVSDETTENGTYRLSVCKEGMPPHVTEDHATLAEVEASLDGTLGYHRGAEVWESADENE